VYCIARYFGLMEDAMLDALRRWSLWDSGGALPTLDRVLLRRLGPALRSDLSFAPRIRFQEVALIGLGLA